jgi:hypothetical protein
MPSKKSWLSFLAWSRSRKTPSAERCGCGRGKLGPGRAGMRPGAAATSRRPQPRRMPSKKSWLSFLAWSRSSKTPSAERCGCGRGKLGPRRAGMRPGAAATSRRPQPRRMPSKKSWLSFLAWSRSRKTPSAERCGCGRGKLGPRRAGMRPGAAATSRRPQPRRMPSKKSWLSFLAWSRSSKTPSAERCGCGRGKLGPRRAGMRPGAAATSRRPQPRRMLSKKSWLFFVARILSSKNSIASRSSIGYKSLRRIQIFCRTSGLSKSSSRRVPERLTLMAG